MQLNETRVRERAYKIWESEGKPEGCAEKHWSMACEYEEASQDPQADSYETLGQEDPYLVSDIQPKKKSKKSHH